MTAAAIDKALVRQAFASASGTYDNFARLQRSVGLELLDRADLPELFGTIMDLGCGTGFITEILLKRFSNIDRLVAVDIATDMLHATRLKMASNSSLNSSAVPAYVCADAEHLPFADEAVDSIVSNLALQWCHDLERVFTDFGRVLKSSGLLLFSTFGPETLNELKYAWAVADDHTHVNQFYSPEHIHQLLIQSGFTAVRIDRQCHRPAYPSVYALMHELKQIGAHNVNQLRNKQLTGKGRLLKMIEAYERYRLDDGFPASFDVLRIMARKN